MFLPATRKEMEFWGWSELDVVLVTGDAYIDSPLIGVAMIGRVLVRAGYRVGIIAQPDLETADITRLGEPRLFWGVTAGSIDSMVANTTALKKRRRDDDYTPGGVNNRRPDHASIAYINLIRRHFKGTAPIVLGGLEASLRRIAHYDYWSDSIRRSLLFDAKADLLVYGMGEKTVVDLADTLRDGLPLDNLRGICRIVKEKPKEAIELPMYEIVREDKHAFIEMFRTFHNNADPVTALPLAQLHGDRWLLQHPPQVSPSRDEIDSFYELEFSREAHPLDANRGEIRALETIRFSLATHRGCYGECNFCAIASHQGRSVQSRSHASILKEAKALTHHPRFKGVLYDGGSPTGNMYDTTCPLWEKKGVCDDKQCLSPEICQALKLDHSSQVTLLKALRSLPGVKHVFVTSGLRYDMILADDKAGEQYLNELVENHVSGQLKVAPEHTEDSVLEAMGKPGREVLEKFRDRFIKTAREAEKKTGRKAFLTYYLIAAHPGCSEHEMKTLKRYTRKNLKIQPEQVQIFTPLPSTWSAVMYWTGMNPFTGEPIFVERNPERKKHQKEIVISKAQK
ncbi:YgiQ family radical SAM protein [Calditrichota bacterium]